AYLLCVKSLEELPEVRLGIVRARRCLGVILHREDRGLPVLQPFYRSVIEVTVGHFERFGTWDRASVTPHREAVVLRRYKYLSRRKIPYRVVAPPVAVWKFDRFSAECEPEQLVAQADAEDRQAAIGQLAQRRDGIADGGGDGVARLRAHRHGAAHRSLGADVARELARIDVGDDRHARGREPVGESAGRPPV